MSMPGKENRLSLETKGSLRVFCLKSMKNKGFLRFSACF